MHKLWLIARHEYKSTVRKRSFLVATLGIPLMILGVMAFTVFSSLGGQQQRPLGYVHHTAMLDASLAENEGAKLEIRAYAREDAARVALDKGELQAYYVVPADYLSSQQIKMFYDDQVPGELVQQRFDDFLRRNLVRNQPAAVQQRLLDGVNLTIRSATGGRELEARGPLTIVLPFIIAFFFYFAVSSAGSYMLQAVASEKENRTVEVIATSCGPGPLIGGKAVGLMGVALTQIAIWALTGVLVAVVGAHFEPSLGVLQVPWDSITISLLFFLPTFALVAGLMTIVGGSVTELQQGQQVASIINMLFVFPTFLTAVFIAAPNSPLVVGLMMFPTTAFLTVVLRWSMTAIPLWQLALSWVILSAAAVGSFWAAARVFRMGMLRYGQRMSLPGVIAALRGCYAPTNEGRPAHA